MNENFSDLPGPRLRQLREQSHLSLAGLAKQSGTSPSALHRYESGWGGFELKTLVRVAAALGARLEIHLSRRASEEKKSSIRKLMIRWRHLFWDIDLTENHLEQHADWLLRRVLQFGDWEDVHQARMFFGDDAVSRAATHRSMDVRTRRFWQIVLDPSGMHQ